MHKVEGIERDTEERDQGVIPASTQNQTRHVHHSQVSSSVLKLEHLLGKILPPIYRDNHE
jgi:hypothetical protein